MPADSLHIRLVAEELDEILRGARIEKITMPEPDEVVLMLHTQSGTRALVLSANASLPRAHLSACPPRNNPLVAPAFLMHLRKHIGGALVTAVSAYAGERILRIFLTARNDLGYEENKTLICEIIGKYANIVLVNGEGKISECIRHVSPAGSEVRPVLAGLPYTYPPRQNKVDLYDTTALRALLDGFEGGKIGGYILAGGAGLAPATIDAVVLSSLGVSYAETLTQAQKDKLAQAFDDVTHLRKVRPVLRRDGNKTDFWLYPFDESATYTPYPTLNEAMDEHFRVLDRDKRLQEKLHTPKTVVKNAIARTEKKLKLFVERQSEASDLARDKLYGELITANMYRVRQGMKTLEAENYYEDPPAPVVIPLQENKSPQYNAQAYYRKYAKKKKTLEMISAQIQQAEQDLEYYRSLYDSFSYTDADGIDEILTELYDAELLHAPKDKRKREKQGKGGELSYEGCVIRWGKTNLQNDRLTREAKGDDTWLHTQKIHGSHVIISGGEVTDKVLLRAAQIAAYYSKGRLADNVPVDYTLRKFVSKPKGSPPGKVIYTHYKTVYVTPRDERE